MLKLFCYLIASLCILAIAHGQGGKEVSLSKELDQVITAHLPPVAPGCVVLVVKKGNIVYEKAFGKANLELNVAMRPEMVFRIGSVTKQYTAISILQLVEQGKIFLQDGIQKFIPDFPDKGHVITIENLLTHTSGLIDYEALDFHIPNAIRIDFPAKQIIDSLGVLPLDFTPGSKYNYSNTNYFILAYIIELISGKSYKDYVRDNLFKPAGLTHTYYDSPTEIIPNRINGYVKYNSKYFNPDYVSMTQVFGAGALLSNVEDLYKWHQALYLGKLVKKETLEKAFTPYRLADGSLSSYGYGWFIKQRNDMKSIEHAGGIDGFQSDEIYFPEQDIFIATLYNSLNEGGSDMSFITLDNEIATLAVGQKLAKEIHVDSSELKQFAGVYEFDPQHSLIITLKDGQLYAEAPNGGLPASPLFAKTKNLFFLKVIDAQFEFIKDKSGAVTQVITHFQGKSEVSKKIK